MVTRKLRDALAKGRRDALVSLVESLADEIDGCPNARDRLPLVRAFLAAVAALEALDASARREARAEARLAGSGHPVGPSPLDDLVRARGAKRHARV